MPEAIEVEAVISPRTEDGIEVDEPKKKADFTPSHGLTTAEADELRVQWGKNELEEKSKPKWLVFVELLYGPMPCVIWVAFIIEMSLHNWLDGGILFAIQMINAVLGWYETIKAADAVAALKASLKPTATVKRGGVWANADATMLVPGDLVLLGAGSAIPADCLVNEGRIEVDQSALTGESMPVTMYKGDSAKMGSTVTRGEVEATVEFTGKHTFFGKTATMLQAADGIGHLAQILLRIMIVLVSISVMLCVAILIFLIVYGKEEFATALEFVVVVLVASVPIAIEVVCTATLALGSRQLSAHGAIVTRLASIEEMAGMNMLCSDKTGTLTLNKMVIQDDCPIYTPGVTKNDVLTAAGLAAKWKEPPRDALDTLVLQNSGLDLSKLNVYEQLEFLPFDPTVKRTEGTLKGPDGKVFKTTKGAPHIILKLVQVDAEDISKRLHWKVHELGLRGIRSLAVARTDDEGKWRMLGILTFLDPPRPDTKDTIEKAMEYGVDVKMITGDHAVIAKETARALGLGANIQEAGGLPSMEADGKIPKDLGKKYGAMIIAADGFAQVFPEHKYLIVEALRQEGFAVGMTGDGVNDAPALKRADVGIAVSGATDAARAAADMVLTQEGLSVIVHAIEVSRAIFARMKNFINYRIACTLQLVCFFFVAVFALEPKKFRPDDDLAPDFFKMPVLMLILITVLNDGTLISVAYDHVVPSRQPEKWNLKVLWVISAVLASIAMLSSILLLWAAIDSGNPAGVFQRWGLPLIHYDQIITMMYLKVSVSDFLTLFSARTHSGFFWSMRPSPILLGAATLALGLSTIIACLWPGSRPDGIPTRGLALDEHYTLWALWVWIYCIVWWLIQDTCKVAAYWVMARLNLFQINTAKLVNMRAAQTFSDKPLARASAGLVETKLMELKVDKAIDSVGRMASAPGADSTASTNMRRISADLVVMRNAARLTRNSMRNLRVQQSAGGAAGGDVEAGAGNAEQEAARMHQSIAQMEAAIAAALPEARPELQATLDGLKAAAARLEAVQQVVRTEDAAGDKKEKELRRASL
ncbi:hypothetical protein OEZ85_012477 [Tetradesmus obliquus]|uniref:Plasma membrane ATPase n=1 Tax=Tetradesmus obliquus TaxID=3088 RepID=A0ABY8TVZ4_TETOB|nr:hypothetical protein OEZ85_012477 [Tetradesmus obliquus]